MSVQNYEINGLIEKIADHMDVVLNNAFIRKALTKITLPHEYQAGVDILLSRSESYRVNGYLFDEIYRGILGLAMWVYVARTEILPDLKYALSGGAVPASDRIREQMAVENLKSNLSILSDDVNNLYIRTAEADKAAHRAKPPVYQRIVELSKLGQFLTSDTRGLLR